jgi:hypothetical protein
MPLALIGAVEEILRQVEERTGKAIQCVERKDLPMSDISRDTFHIYTIN